MKNKIPACALCGSKRLKEVEKDIIFAVENPKVLRIRQKFTECQSCGEGYFDEKQSGELARKIDKQLKVPSKLAKSEKL